MFFKHSLTCLLLWLSLILPCTTSGRGERPPPLTCPPSLHSAILLQQTTNSQRVVQHTSWGEDQQEDTQIPKGCQCPCSRYTSVRAPQTYNVKCSQGLKVLRDEENVWTALIQNRVPFSSPCHRWEWRKSSAIFVMITMIIKSVVIVEVEWVSWRASVIVYISPSPPPTHSYTHSHSSTCSTYDIFLSNCECEMPKLSRRRRRRRRRPRSLFNQPTTSWPTPSEWDSCH